MRSLIFRPGLDWSPRSLNLTSNLFDSFDELFEDMAPILPAYDERRYQMTAPAIDVSETDEHYLVSCDLPGMKKDEIKIELHGQTLTVSGERKREVGAGEKTDNNRRYERSYGFFRRSFTLPESVDADNVEASYENGVLEIAIPKAASARPRRIQIQSSKSAGGLFNKLLNSKKTPEESKEPSEKAV